MPVSATTATMMLCVSARWCEQASLRAYDGGAFDTHSRLDPMRKYRHLEIDVASRKPFMHWTRLQYVEDTDGMARRTATRRWLLLC